MGGKGGGVGVLHGALDDRKIKGYIGRALPLGLYRGYIGVI